MPVIQLNQQRDSGACWCRALGLTVLLSRALQGSSTNTQPPSSATRPAATPNTTKLLETWSRFISERPHFKRKTLNFFHLFALLSLLCTRKMSIFSYCTVIFCNPSNCGITQQGLAGFNNHVQLC